MALTFPAGACRQQRLAYRSCSKASGEHLLLRVLLAVNMSTSLVFAPSLMTAAYALEQHHQILLKTVRHTCPQQLWVTDNTTVIKEDMQLQFVA